MSNILPFPSAPALSAPRDPAPFPDQALAPRLGAVQMPSLPRNMGNPILHGANSPRLNVRRRRFMDLAELTERLGLDRYERRTIIDRLRLLHDQAGMPAPHLPRQRGGALLYGAAAIHAGALWDRGAMLVWLDNPIGPSGHAPGGDAATPPGTDVIARDAERLAARAAQLLERKRA